MRLLRALAALALVFVSVASCKKSGPASPGVYNQTYTGSVSSFGYRGQVLDTPKDGTLTVTLTWSGAVDLDLYLTNSNCADIYGQTPCDKLNVSEASSGQSETITRTVSKVDGLKAWVDNFTDASTDYEIRIQIE